MAKAPTIWIPGQGTRPLVTADKCELPWGVMERVLEFADVASAHQMGLHCAKCSQDFTGTNDDNDSVLSMKCGCREFWSTNPRAGRTH